MKPMEAVSLTQAANSWCLPANGFDLQALFTSRDLGSLKSTYKTGRTPSYSESKATACTFRISPANTIELLLLLLLLFLDSLVIHATYIRYVGTISIPQMWLTKFSTRRIMANTLKQAVRDLFKEAKKSKASMSRILKPSSDGAGSRVFPPKQRIEDEHFGVRIDKGEAVGGKIRLNLQVNSNAAKKNLERPG
jgi:hypothetical protein